MLQQAVPDERVTYEQAPAEALPLEDASSDVMTLASVFHWLDRDAFLAEAHRVLKPRGHLLIYDSHFAGEMTGNPDFTVWHTEHRKRFPSPALKRQEPFEAADASQAGFEWHVNERFGHEVEFTPQLLKSYFLSQSNAATDPERMNVWLEASVPGLFLQRESAEFRFRTAIAYLRHAEGPACSSERA